MRRSRRLATNALLMACVAGVAGCGKESGRPDGGPVLAYRPVGLDVKSAPGPKEHALSILTLSYAGSDGQRVPAQFAVPTGRSPLGCLIYQGGYGTTKEQQPNVRAGFAALRLATFTIDPRNVGARGSLAKANVAIRDPITLRAMLLDTVADLRNGLDYLESRRECRHNIGVMGTSFGAMLATMLAAQDTRIKAAVITSVGATFKQALVNRPLAAKSVPNLPQYVPAAATDPAALARADEILGPYDLDTQIGRIAPRPVMVVEGRFDPIVVPADGLALADAAGSPKSVFFFDGGHDPLAEGPDRARVMTRIARFLVDGLSLPNPGL